MLLLINHHTSVSLRPLLSFCGYLGGQINCLIALYSNPSRWIPSFDESELYHDLNMRS
jgi:hypothetical protein